MKRAGSHGECALIRVRGLWCCAPFCAQSKQDRKLVTEPVNDTKLAALQKVKGWFYSCAVISVSFMKY